MQRIKLYKLWNPLGRKWKWLYNWDSNLRKNRCVTTVNT